MSFSSGTFGTKVFGKLFALISPCWLTDWMIIMCCVILCNAGATLLLFCAFSVFRFVANLWVRCWQYTLSFLCSLFLSLNPATLRYRYLPLLSYCPSNGGWAYNNPLLSPWSWAPANPFDPTILSPKHQHLDSSRDQRSQCRGRISYYTGHHRGLSILRASIRLPIMQ